MDREKLARDCLWIEKAGGSVLEHLRALGCVSPWGTWHRLQKEELGRTEAQITDGKGADNMKMTNEMRETAVQIAIDGGDPLAYLKEQGSKSPKALWYSIKKMVELEDPERRKLIPDGRTGESPNEESMRETCESMSQTIMDEEFTVTGLQTKIGEFHSAAGNLCWYRHGQQMVNLQIEDWKILIGMVPKVLRAMGLE